ncbi:glycoside hydrolase family 18 protein [Occallatibacter riparius]|uniref:chitinase n=1 Tax=Occallatibacter riparius TaxID=1002689 RepID=A0A9J7BL42_9BACT|nr:glycosyl hydrolase family 18 protein [Occallatibacter riparius]UWZ83169.1 glycosyl hydrolase family 18 protein [Occallatibacter riparius]
MVGYYPQWGMFNTRPYNVKNLVTSGAAPLLTHLIYAFSDIENNQCATYDDWADYRQPLPAVSTLNGIADVEAPGVLAGNFHQLQLLKKSYPSLPIMISIGGGGMDPAVFATAAQPQNRQAFVASCINMYIKGNFAPGLSGPGIFTGIDIDWEFPKNATDLSNYLALLQEFRTQLNALGSGYLLTSVGGTWWGQWDYMNLNAAQSFVDFFNVPMYDFDGPWSNMTGLNAPLSQASFDPSAGNNASSVVAKYLAMGVEKQKIVFGMPLYGWRWTKVGYFHQGLFQPGTPDSYPYPYWQIAALTGYTKYRDSKTQEPWLWNASTLTFWTYDDATSLTYKSRWAAAQGLGGVMFWELSNDTPSGTLFKAAVKGFGGCDIANSKCGYSASPM